MAANDIHLTTTWRIEGHVDEARAALATPADLPRWWPAVYLEAREVEPGSGDVTAKGWLPYTLRCRIRAEEPAPDRVTWQIEGDYTGSAAWSFAQVGPEVVIEVAWDVRGNKRLMRYFSWLLRPIFAANCRWALGRGRDSLRLELARRRAADDDARSRIPDPPGPTPSSLILLLLSPFVVGAAVLVIAGFRRGPSSGGAGSDGAT